jgi:alpha-D-ribose 1-methylphosphonate 5-triphosphate diphosphatase
MLAAERVRSAMREQVFGNALVVTADAVLAGHVAVHEGAVAAVAAGTCTSTIDCDGDYLLPGLVELHTDHLESHVSPRPGVRWPIRAAMLAHDAQIAAAGITTVFDALALGEFNPQSLRHGLYADAIQALDALAAVTRAEHFLHLRCEIAVPGAARAFDRFIAHRASRLVSLMDHTPGQRQFVDLDKYVEYHKGKFGYSDAEMTAMIDRRREQQQQFAVPQRAHIVDACAARGVVLASHDDATAAHIDEAVASGVAIAEFPTTREAAGAAHRHKMTVIAGAPNVVRGGSHSGNIAAIDLARDGLLDALSSDYVPSALLQAAFTLHDKLDLALPDAVATVTRNPARMVGMDDRGAIAPGKRADLVQVRVVEGLPVVRGVWRAGVRVA